MTRVVVVGAGLAGLRTAEALRANGYSGSITVVGDEEYLPYNRPPLSKEALLTGVDPEKLEFRRRDALADVEWVLGQAVREADLAAGRVRLADGSTREFDGLVIASGIRPRLLPIPGPREGRVVLRTIDDARALRPLIRPGAQVIILGAGFIGCEVAATARKLGANVHVVAIDPEPMVRPLGVELGAGMRRRHEAHGVHFHLGIGIDACHGHSTDERLASVSLSNGTELPADLLVEAVGSVTNVEWLTGNGLDLSDGVHVDSGMRVVGTDAFVVAAGDVARYPNALFGPVARRIEHWNMPTETGRRAGATLAALLAGEEPTKEPFTAMPSFWSDQYEHTIQSFGMPGLATDIVMAAGTPDEPCIAEYRDDSGLVGVVGIDRTSELAPYRKELMARRPVTSEHAGQ
ncbi:MAG: NAD(P)/FAD-dependent oxidoreductase [Actinomycetales bacterium]|nr:NAD(P)/FAD-dependent oxidoreductase [Actinomycetales bacterium]